MTGAEALGLLNTISSILRMIGGWPLGLSVAVIIFGPWLVMLFIARSLEKQSAQHDLETIKLVNSIKDVIGVSVKVYEARHLEAVQMYKNSNELVKSIAQRDTDQAAQMYLNTQAMTRLVDKIEAMYPRGRD